MRKNSVMALVTLFLLVLVSGCGGGGGDTNLTPVVNQSQIAISPSKSIALADNVDTVTITASFTGATPADRTPVVFSVTSGTATLGSTTVETTGGVATTTVRTSTPGLVTVAATSGTTATTSIKFISQPTAMNVTIALNPAVSALATLQFNLVNSAGAAYTANSLTLLNTALNQFAAAGQQPGSDTTTVALISAAGFDTSTAPIMNLSYAVTAGLPAVTVSPTGITATKLANPSDVTSGTNITLTPDNFLVTVKYNTDTF